MPVGGQRPPEVKHRRPFNRHKNKVPVLHIEAMLHIPLGSRISEAVLKNVVLGVLESVRLAVASPKLRASFFASVRDLQELNIDVLMRLNDETYTNVPDSPGFSGKISTC